MRQNNVLNVRKNRVTFNCLVAVTPLLSEFVLQRLLWKVAILKYENFMDNFFKCIAELIHFCPSTWGNGKMNKMKLICPKESIELKIPINEVANKINKPDIKYQCAVTYSSINTDYWQF